MTTDTGPSDKLEPGRAEARQGSESPSTRPRQRRRLLSTSQLRRLARQRTRLMVLLLALPPALVVLVDLGMRGSRLLDLEGKYLLSYGAAVLESAVLWGVLLICASARRGALRWVFSGLLVVMATMAVGGQIYFHGQYSTYLNLDATLWGASMAGSTWSQVTADAGNFLRAVGPVIVGCLVLIWLGRRLLRPRRRTLRVLRLAAPVVVAAAFLIPCSYRSVQASTPDVIYLHAMGGLVKGLSGPQSASQIRPGRRTPPELPALDAAPTRPRNVLFILLEGVRADAACADPAQPCQTMPEVMAATPNRIGFEQMRSNSSTTAIELAVMWAGLPPTSSREALHTAPMLFDYAHAAGMDTAYWTSHHMLFANSLLFVQDLPTRFQCGATRLDPLADIDLGADDRLLTARIQEEIGQLAEPFFAVVQYGNTHMPYLIDEDDAPFQPHLNSRAPGDNDAFRNRYLNSIHRQDKTIAELLRFVRASALGERTVVFFTSDHGEAFREHGQLGHTGSMFDVELHVPGWFDAPEGTLSPQERAALESYRKEPVFHSDLTPTMLDLLGLGEAAALEPYRQAMVGYSLLRPGRPEPMLALTNCTQIWGCAFENWGVMHRWRKVHAREWDTSWLCYDVQADPAELHPLPLADCTDLVDHAETIYGGLPGKP